MGALEETSIDEIRAQFETNFFGAVRVMQAVIRTMRKKRGGIIVNITSLGGRISFCIKLTIPCNQICFRRPIGTTI